MQSESGDDPNKKSSPEDDRLSKLPEELPILPLRGVVVYPETAVPLTIGQPRSIRLVDEVVAGERLIGLVTSRDPELENPGPEDLYQIGTVAMVHRLFRAPDGTIRLLVQGIARFKLSEFTQLEPYLKAKISLYPGEGREGLEVEALARNARDQFEHIAEMIPSIPRELVASITSLEDPCRRFTRSPTSSGWTWQTPRQSSRSIRPRAKLHRLVGILAREGEVLEIGQKIQNEARSEIEKMQREYFLREQLKAIQTRAGRRRRAGGRGRRIPQEDRSRQHARRSRETGPPRAGPAVPPADRCSRVRRHPHLPGLAGHPCPGRSAHPDNLDIAHARQVLDQDHYGLKDVKERILEYPGGAQAAPWSAQTNCAEMQKDDDPPRARRRDPVLRRPSRGGQDLPWAVDRPRHGAQVHPHLAGRRAR